MSFCTNCGSELSPGDLFCADCGTRVISRVSKVSKTPSEDEITIEYVAPESELFEIDGQKGLSRHLLVFTDRRLIVGLVGGGETRLVTGGILRLAYEGQKIKKMKERDLSDLLSEDNTYTIPYDQINRVVVEKGGRLRAGTIIINRSFGEEEKFKVDIRKRVKGFERIMKPVFGEKLTIIR